MVGNPRKASAAAAEEEEEVKKALKRLVQHI